MDRWWSIDRIYREAQTRPADERTRFLAEACAGDPAMRREVELLLAQAASAEVRIAADAESGQGAGDPALQGAGDSTLQGADSPAALVGRQLGVYRLTALLGAGGIGEVYRAHDTRLGRDVAIKVLRHEFSADSDQIARFEREARVLASLHHPHICTLHDVGRDTGIAFFVMEHLEGETLQQRLTRGPFDISEVSDLALALADALEAAHAKKIIHRDIKPGNIFLTARGPKFLDFGLAKPAVASRDHDESEGVTLTGSDHLTNPGAAVGTVAYMSPEQLRGEPLDGRSDLFSFGLVLYEMATGRRAFSGPTTAVITAAILEKPVVAPRTLRPDIPIAFEHLILKAVEKDRDLRCQTAAELRGDLRRLKREIDSRAVATAPDGVAVRDSGGLAAEKTAIKTATVDEKHRRWVAVIAAVVVLAVVAAGFVLVKNRQVDRLDSGALLPNAEVVQLTVNGNAFEPAIAPDGKYAAYVQRDGDKSSLWIRQTTSGGNVQIVPSDGNVQLRHPTVTPDGIFVDFIRTKESETPQLWRVPFLGGTPRRLADNVWSAVGWSPDGRRMAFIREGDLFATETLIVADSDATHERGLITRKRPGGLLSSTFVGQPIVRPAWSPDGVLIALFGFVMQEKERQTQIIFVDVSTGSERTIPVSGSPQELKGLAWLDSESLLLSREAGPGTPAQLWTVSYPGGEMTRLTNDLTGYAGVSVTSDRGSLVTPRIETRVGVWVGDNAARNGTEVVPPAPFGTAFAALVWAADRVLYASYANGMMSVAGVVPGREASQEVLRRAIWPAATSDGKTIIYQSLEPSGIWKVDGEGGHPVELVPGPAFSPVISPDDKYVLYVSPRNGVQSPWMVSIDGGEQIEIVNTFAGLATIQVSPDGKSFFFGTIDPRNQNRESLVVCDFPKCTSRRKVTVPLRRPEWTSDGRGVAYVDLQGSNIWIQSLDGGPPSQLTQFSDGMVFDFAWSRDGKRLAVLRGTVSNDVVLFKGLKR
ncbi:MAG: hypothetical protein C5B57_12760 [Blastocatellia bacterium]|nr:MAG: hypothetical protein C5B57_12760 [Blastocatellia bacterium]